MAKIFRTGKKVRPKIAVKGKRYHSARCRTRSPKPVETPAPVVLSQLPETRRPITSVTTRLVRGHPLLAADVAVNAAGHGQAGSEEP